MKQLFFPLGKNLRDLSEAEINNSIYMPKTQFYTFNNFYMQGIQAGIQAKHSSDELISKYVFNKKPDNINVNTLQLLKTVYKRDKTAILLNGGGQVDLVNLIEFFDSLDNNIYPYAYFREENDALNNAMTSVTAVFPELIFSNDGLKSLIKSFSIKNNVKDLTFYDLTNQYDDTAFPSLLDNIFKFKDYFNEKTMKYIADKVLFKSIENLDNLYIFIRENPEKETQDILFFNETDFLITKKLMKYRLMT
tara:strand:- start:16091 stop:16837 length:747 start_codon:yes stop_codon:yes gene_type:complete